MMFEVRGGCFRYSKEGDYIVNNVSLAVESGELLAILGPNGAGKTTMLRTMIGLQRWTKGASYLDGVELSAITQRERGKLIAYVPQARTASTLSLSGVDMVVLGRAAHLGTYAQPGAEERERAYRVLASIGASHLADVHCAAMSGGQYQMVLIARALIAEPKLLVLDEPETGLDFHNQLVVLDVLQDLVENRGLAVVMNTHYPAHALRLAQQVVLTDAHRQSSSGPAAEIITEESMAAAFDAQVHLGTVHAHGWEVPTVTPVCLNGKIRD